MARARAVPPPPVRREAPARTMTAPSHASARKTGEQSEESREPRSVELVRLVYFTFTGFD